ncbi:MAG: hypothetical protein Q8N51_03110 [Gammaproteobacteria bacterium]|nr:hypothetical protein [Gammaproteobacteria bacterium]
MIAAAIQQNKRRGPFFREQRVWKDQITTTLRLIRIAALVERV